MTFYKNGSSKERIGQEKVKCSKETISDNRGSKIINRIIEERTDSSMLTLLKDSRYTARGSQWKQVYQQ